MVMNPFEIAQKQIDIVLEEMSLNSNTISF